MPKPRRWPLQQSDASAPSLKFAAAATAAADAAAAAADVVVVAVAAGVAATMCHRLGASATSLKTQMPKKNVIVLNLKVHVFNE